MDELLDCDFAVAEKDRLYRCLDRVLIHKDALCQHLVEQWKTLFDARFDILLYDLLPLVPARLERPRGFQRLLGVTLMVSPFSQ